MSDFNNGIHISKKSLLGFPLTPKQDALINYMVPSIGSCVLFIFLFATDVGLSYRHFKDGKNAIAWLTIIIMYMPVITNYFLTLSALELWPEMHLFKNENFIWAIRKTFEHLLFPIWSLWRFAEKIFWSIEAFRADDDESRRKNIANVSAPRIIELYFFLQAFLHSLPQVLVQLHLLMRHSHKIDKQTAHAQFLSIAFNLTKLAITVAYYQRFKTQKIAGRRYPWYKPYKYQYDPSLDEVTLRRKIPQMSHPIEEENITASDTTSTNPHEEENLFESNVNNNRRSSDLYLEPDIRGSYLPVYASRIQSTSTNTDSTSKWKNRITANSHCTSDSSGSQPDFNIRRVAFIKGLPEDDLAGKLVSFIWWASFLAARILAISAFEYFYPSQAIYILVSHFILTLAILCYDAKSDEVTRSKALFFVFVCYIFLFCIIEFKIRFKKAKFIYYGFFSLVFLENLVMCLVWWYSDLDVIESDFWFKFVFNIIVVCSLFSLISMIFYYAVHKPEKVIVRRMLL